MTDLKDELLQLRMDIPRDIQLVNSNIHNNHLLRRPLIVIDAHERRDPQVMYPQ